MNVVDSSAWLEYFAGGTNADLFAPAIQDKEQLLVPAITIYEVYKRLLSYGDQTVADQNISLLLDSTIVVVDAYLAVVAAENSRQFKLSLADSMILTTARFFRATLWTQDAHFAGIPCVKYIPKP
jgi:predicted nucleic acid-binding protein